MPTIRSTIAEPRLRDKLTKRFILIYWLGFIMLETALKGRRGDRRVLARIDDDLARRP